MPLSQGSLVTTVATASAALGVSLYASYSLINNYGSKATSGSKDGGAGAAAARIKAEAARAASRQLIASGKEGRSAILRHLAKSLIENKDRILAANKKDLEIAEKNGYEF